MSGQGESTGTGPGAGSKGSEGDRHFVLGAAPPILEGWPSMVGGRRLILGARPFRIADPRIQPTRSAPRTGWQKASVVRFRTCLVRGDIEPPKVGGGRAPPSSVLLWGGRPQPGATVGRVRT